MVTNSSSITTRSLVASAPGAMQTLLYSNSGTARVYQQTVQSPQQQTVQSPQQQTVQSPLQQTVQSPLQQTVQSSQQQTVQSRLPDSARTGHAGKARSFGQQRPHAKAPQYKRGKEVRWSAKPSSASVAASAKLAAATNNVSLSHASGAVIDRLAADSANTGYAFGGTAFERQAGHDPANSQAHHSINPAPSSGDVRSTAVTVLPVTSLYPITVEAGA